MRPFWLVLCGLFVTSGYAQTREEKVRDDRKRVEQEGFWLYNDLPGAMQKAATENKPVLVVLRCIPCEECVKLDDDLVDNDPVLRPLLEQFVCVRQVSTNGLDLNRFQFDTDQSFAVFLLNADGTIYGRFGTRSHRTDWLQDVSLAGMAKALQGALTLHQNYPRYKESLEGKTGEPMEVGTPEQFPSLKDKYTASLNYQGDVVKSCIHCHQIGDAQRQWYRELGQPIPEKILYPFPHPKQIGIQFDPAEMAVVKQIVSDSPADRAGLKAGDRITYLQGQPILSIADVQWVLHQTEPNGGELNATVIRNNVLTTIKLSLHDGWRRDGDLSWRVSSWGLRRMSTGGLLLEALDDASRESAKIAPNAMALLIKRVGQYGPHALAKKSGFKEGDILISFDGRRDLMREADLHVHGVTQCQPGQKVDVEVLRNGKTVRLTLPMQL